MVSKFVRRVRTASGAVAVQVVTKQGSQVLDVDHVGSARSDAELAVLLEVAGARLRPGQEMLDLEGLQARPARMQDTGDFTTAGGAPVGEASGPDAAAAGPLSPVGPARARHACVILTADHESTSDVPLRVRLLIDCRTAFGDTPVLPTGVLLGHLVADPEAPWVTLGARGEGLNAMKLGRLLREYDIRPGTYRFAEGQAKGYRAEDFTDAWNRYCPVVEAPPDPGESGAVGEPYQPYQPQHPRSERYGSDAWYGSSRTSDQPPELPWYGSSRTSPQAVPALTRQNEAGTAGTATPPTCIGCRLPMTYDDGTHTHPTCATA